MARSEITLAVLALSVTLAGCGGDQSLGGPVVDGGGGGGGDGIGLCSQGAELELIDDMEFNEKRGNGPSIPWVEGRAGNWFAFNDDTPDSTQFPEPNTYFTVSELAAPREDSRSAVRTTGSGFESWGAGVGFEIAAAFPYDASAYAGVAFWARHEEEYPDFSVRADVTDKNTAPAGRICDQSCDRMEECDRACYDTFGKAFEVTTDWQLFQYSWSEAEQLGWSGNVYPGPVVQEIYGMRFQVDPHVDFGLWIDDVAFLCP